MVVTWAEGRFQRVAGPPRPAPFQAEAGTIVETSPASVAVARALAQRLVAQGGVALIFDYGPERSGTGDTLQSVARHAFADPWMAPGERDLTAHVDFEVLGAAAAAEGVRVLGPRAQGSWLEALGIDHRAAALARAAPHRASEFAAARARLVAPEQMGTLFKVMAWVAPDWPAPDGME
jgi:SAM-dependent MidA family methyltransferase